MNSPKATKIENHSSYDKFSSFLLIIICLFFTLISTVDSFNLQYFGNAYYVIAVILISICSVSTWLVVLALYVTDVISGQRLRSFFQFIVNSFVAYALSFFMLFSYGGDYLHLMLVYPSYVRSGRLNGDDKRNAEFDWGRDAISLGGEEDFTLIYDVSNTVEEYKEDELKKDKYMTRNITHLIGRFYLVRLLYE